MLDSIYLTPEGYLIKFTDIKFYLSNIYSNQGRLKEACLFDLRDNGFLLLDTAASSFDISSLFGIIGVDSSLNHLDPSAFANESPLNISNAGLMHWSWNTGYIFINIEGKLDTIPNEITNLDHNFSFHVGMDSFTQNFEFNDLVWTQINDTLSETNFKLNMFELFHGQNSIDLKTEFLSHSGAGQEALALKIAQNFKNSFSK